MFSDVMDRFDSMDQTYVKKLMFQIAITLLIIGGLNWLLVGLFEFDVVASLFGDGVVSTMVYVAVGIAALSIMFDRDTYLPFLGPMVAPCSVLKDQSPSGANKIIKVTVSPYTKVLYWAAEPSNEGMKSLSTWKEAYLEYGNAGVATSDGQGVAILQVRDPQPYKVPFKGLLPPHVHYRACGEAGWMGRIQTAYVSPSSPEGFEDVPLRAVGKKAALGEAAELNMADSSASQF
jgi:uncharacterized membrane protein YuzA (DUF378 family)